MQSPEVMSVRPHLILLLCGCLLACGPVDAPSSYRGGKDDGTARGLDYPIVLVHGFNAHPGTWGAFADDVVDRLAEQVGADRVFVAALAPDVTTEQRGRDLARFILQTVLPASGATKVHIIGHSQGGIDARWVASPQGGHGGRAEPFVASVTSVSGHHRGTPVADRFLFGDPEGDDYDRLYRAVGELMGLTLNDEARRYDTDFKAMLVEMSPAGASRFNERYPDLPEVVYLSWAGVSHVASLPNPWISDADWCNSDAAGNPLANPAWNLGEGHRDAMNALLISFAPLVTSRELGPSDGVVNVSSAKWGLFRGCLRADHLDVVGQSIIHTDRHQRGGFDAKRFYAHDVVGDLRSLERGWLTPAEIRAQLVVRPAAAYR